MFTRKVLFLVVFAIPFQTRIHAQQLLTWAFEHRFDAVYATAQSLGYSQSKATVENPGGIWEGMVFYVQWNADGRVTGEYVGEEKSPNYEMEYNEAGQLIRQEMTVKYTVPKTFEYDEVGRLIQQNNLDLKEAVTMVEKFTWEARRIKQSQLFDKGGKLICSSLFTWSADGRSVTEQEEGCRSGGRSNKILYQFNDKGQLLSSIPEIGDAATFEYDARGRLTSMNTNYGSWQVMEKYLYDERGLLIETIITQSDDAAMNRRVIHTYE